MHETFSCQTKRQKSNTVSSVGPWLTIYAFGFNKLYIYVIQQKGEKNCN